MIWSGRILSILAAFFMLFDALMKIVKPPQVLEANARLAYPISSLTGIGIALMGCTLIYLIPRTSILGAILLTGYLGDRVIYSSQEISFCFCCSARRGHLHQKSSIACLAIAE